jgi:TonB family protein
MFAGHGPSDSKAFADPTSDTPSLYETETKPMKHGTFRVTIALAFVLSALAAGGPVFAQSTAPDYEKNVRNQILMHATYPRLAKMREQEGSVTYQLTLDPAGGVKDVSVETSSGNPSLDDAALDAVKSAAPFPAPPGGAPVTLHGTVAFKLD